MRFSNKTLFAGVLLSFASLSAFAAPNGKVNYEATAGGSYKSGNVNKLETKASAEIYRVDSVFSFDVYGKFNYTETDHVGKDKGVDAYVKIDLYEFNRWSPFFAVEYLHNEYKGYLHKVSVLLGEKYRIYQTAKSDYSISMAVMYDNDEYVKDKVKTERENLFRFSLRPKMKQKLGETILLVEQLYYQPRIDQFDDYVFKNLTALDFKLTKIVSFGIDCEYDYRSVVPMGKDKKTGETFYYEHDDFTLHFNFKFRL